MLVKRPINILVAEDDDDDKLLIIKAFQKSIPKENITCVSDGEALLQYLNRSAPYDKIENYSFPDIILLDLNMPKKDGRKALAEIKSHKEFKKIPVIIFSTSNLKDDIEITYKMGSNSYITKPGTFEGIVKVAKEIENYWSNTVQLPV